MLLITVMVRWGGVSRLAPCDAAAEVGFCDVGCCCADCGGALGEAGATAASAVAGTSATELVAAPVGFTDGDGGARRGETILSESVLDVVPRGELVTRLALRRLRADAVLAASTDAMSIVAPLLLLCAPGATGLRGERVTPRCRLLVEAFSAVCPPWPAAAVELPSFERDRGDLLPSATGDKAVPVLLLLMDERGGRGLP